MQENLQPFDLFEHKGKVQAHFRSPTVSDYRALVGVSGDIEERMTTQFLNDLQIIEKNKNKALNDSSMWTAEDRRAALYWIYILTRDNTIITQSYACQHCSQKHSRQIDLIELGDLMTESTHSMTDRINVKGVKSGLIHPLRGYAVEHVELLRNERDEHDEHTKAWRVAHTDLVLMEIAYGITFDDDDKSLPLDEQAQARFDYLLTLNADKQYKKLMAQVRLAWSNMRHGLLTEYSDGDTRLVTPPHTCPNSTDKGGNGKETILLLPFRNSDFLPDL